MPTPTTEIRTPAQWRASIVRSMTAANDTERALMGRWRPAGGWTDCFGNEIPRPETSEEVLAKSARVFTDLSARYAALAQACTRRRNAIMTEDA